jgi:ribonuclease HI
MIQGDIFADGSCLDNGKPSAKGGWSVIVTPTNSTDILTSKFGKLRAGKQTNNRAELEAMLQALLFIESQPKDMFYTIYSDSDTVVSGINGTAGRNANRDIWEDVEEMCTRLVGRFTVAYIEGHISESTLARHQNNCQADKLAKQGANSLLIAPYEPRKKEL